VVVLSVDGKMGGVETCFEAAPEPEYTVGWVGVDAFKDAQIQGIPSLFVLDRERAVFRFIQGFAGNEDKRLERALDEILGEEQTSAQAP